MVLKDFVLHHIVRAGDIAREYFVRGVSHTHKSNPSDFLTEADTSVSAYLVDAIHREFPDHHIKSEELSVDINPGAEYEWIIDPIDGTRNFATRIPIWSVVIAVVQNGTPLYGAVYFPIADHLFFAEIGKGAFLNHEPIKVSQRNVLTYSRGAIYRAAGVAGPYGTHIEKYRRAIGLMMLNGEGGYVNFGCASSMCYVASGALDFMLCNSGLDWDYVAPILICREAGAHVTDSDGREWVRGRQDHVVANPDLHPKLMDFFMIK